jgi:ribose transport system substrate-binding protein
MSRFSARAAAAAALAAAAIAGCGDASSGGHAVKVAYSDPVGAQPGQQAIELGFRRGARELGWGASSIDANLSPDKQVSDIATMVTQRQSGIASWTLDPGAAAGAYGQAAAAGIPVVGVNSQGPGIDATVWWELNLCFPGAPIEDVTAFIAAARPGARVIMVGGPPVPSIMDYERCFAANARKHGLDVVATVHNTRDTAATAQPLVADALTRHPDVDAIWAYNDASALGASAAVLDSHRTVAEDGGPRGGVIVFGQNGDADAIAAIRQGRLTGTVDPDSVATGWTLIKALSGFVGDHRPEHPPKRLVVRSTTWTKRNIARYRAPQDRRYTLSTLPIVHVPAG